MSSINARNERILVETDRYRVEGDLTLLPHEDFLDAIYKYMNRNDQEFLHLTNVEAVALDGSGQNWNSPALNLEIRHIRAIIPQRE
jgi:hypothetical protein